MTQRAASEEGTRLRITESAVELHGTLGPSQTSVSAIAEHAGVRRSTLYRHFPDERALFAACSSHWMAANPMPDMARWTAIDSFPRRLGEALEELYPYYRRTQRMLANVLRDEATMPVLQELVNGYRGYLAAAKEVLLQGQKRHGPHRRSLEASIGHALSFAVWRSLAMEQGLDDRECARLMGLLVRASQGEGSGAAANPSPQGAGGRGKAGGKAKRNTAHQ